MTPSPSAYTKAASGKALARCRMRHGDEAAPARPTACMAMYDAATQRVTDANNRILAGYIVGGVGVAAAVVGTVLLLTGDDPARYDRKTASSGRPTLTGWTNGSSGGLLLLGRF